MAKPLKSSISVLASKPDFHKAVDKLLAKTNEPCKPVNYRGAPHLQSSKYHLLHEEEQHLADYLAFLAQTSPDPFRVSAVTIEESSTPPSLCIRLAANKTPASTTVTGLRSCLNTVEEFARTGTNRDGHESTLLNQVIELSKSRLHSRIRSQQALDGEWSCEKYKKPLHARIQSLQDSFNTQPSELKESIRPLAAKLSHLIETLTSIDAGSDSEQTKLLREAILSSHAVSTIAGSPLLEHYLDSLGFGDKITQRGTVPAIDKISQYLDVCTYLLDICRKADCQPLFCNITLEALTAPPASHPNGATSKYYVHGEIQLVLYYEQHPREPAPRCIGASKSACFLCDLFLNKHGQFHISHSHKRVYGQWTVPEELWMAESHARTEKLDNILKDMSCEISDLAKMWKGSPKHEDHGAESRVHLLVLPKAIRLVD
ncbi:hypothetical protein DSL72_005034 [Monilinia vaccinii-corymbosi]|uniref:Uncharacterized protein n=1 Tax=Monilinia vaccinii-corymbosi TaxID=61207 RepID=A0A8A3PEJ9_9HELO|nr:hypothetical protein DSL72_005034 [Monilinia vaccinii-corymbosi]